MIHVPDLSKAAALRKAHELGYPVSRLLAKPTDNPKIAKNLHYGVMTAPLHLAPADLSGYEMCAKRTPACTDGCLHYAGNPAHMPQKETSRIIKSRMYIEQRGLFLCILIQEIQALCRKASTDSMLQVGIRLNATSDVKWERVHFSYRDVNYLNLMSMFPGVTFYDYTKISNRRNLPDNYALVFSLADGNDAEAWEAYANGMNVAVVFDAKRSEALPQRFSLNGHSVPVIDGDVHDYRPADPSGVVVGLRAKGRLIGDDRGFVRAA